MLTGFLTRLEKGVGKIGKKIEERNQKLHSILRKILLLKYIKIFKPTVEWNRNWNNYSWEEDGDEWKEQAEYCNQPYEKWKQSLIETFITPNVKKQTTVLNIAPGHGRSTKHIINSKELILVDLNKNCIEYCKKIFSKNKNIKYYVNDGKTLPFIKNNSIDFIWSYDSFVHMRKEVINSYFREFSRILKKQGKAIIHHSSETRKGFRSGVTLKDIDNIIEKNKLHLEFRTDSWGKNKEYNCKLNKDYI